MKTLTVLALLLASLSAAQAGSTDTNGTLDFSNYKPGRLNAPVYDTDNVTRLGANFMAQLYAGPTTNTLASVGSPVPFRNMPAETTGSGYIIAGKVVLANVGQSAPAYVELRAWEASKGASYEAASAAGGKTRRSSIVQVTTGGDDLSPPAPPAVLVGLQSNVNLPPGSSGFGATTPQNQVLEIPLSSLMSPVQDPEGGPVHLVSVSATSTNGAAVASNATAIVYTPQPNFVGADRIDYVVADAQNASHTVSAQIAVLAPGVRVNTFQPPVVAGGTVAFSFIGLPGKSYQVQHAPSPVGPWTNLGTMTIQPNGSGAFLDNNPLAGSGFYRAALLP